MIFECRNDFNTQIKYKKKTVPWNTPSFSLKSRKKKNQAFPLDTGHIDDKFVYHMESENHT